MKFWAFAVVFMGSFGLYVWFLVTQMEQQGWFK